MRSVMRRSVARSASVTRSASPLYSMEILPKYDMRRAPASFAIVSMGGMKVLFIGTYSGTIVLKGSFDSARDDTNARSKLHRAYLFRVIAGAMADFVVQAGLSERDFDAAKVGVRELLLGIVADQVLSAEFIGNLAKGSIELTHAGRVVVFPAGVVGELNQSILAADVATRVGLDGHDDDAVDDGL